MSRAADGVGFVLAAGVWTTALATLPAGLACAASLRLTQRAWGWAS